ncbi:Hypothetical predicted protein [Lynx pardinus]|uniref:Uncharacterized protein n=1 Tax=Lynx pardinus TaxID=191816 RepID=A0A485N156_LYNPA|nr:Hypothetical predicted protein [Lynx pardinus]
MPHGGGGDAGFPGSSVEIPSSPAVCPAGAGTAPFLRHQDAWVAGGSAFTGTCSELGERRRFISLLPAQVRSEHRQHGHHQRKGPGCLGHCRLEHVTL